MWLPGAAVRPLPLQRTLYRRGSAAFRRGIAGDVRRVANRPSRTIAGSSSGGETPHAQSSTRHLNESCRTYLLFVDVEISSTPPNGAMAGSPGRPPLAERDLKTDCARCTDTPWSAHRRLDSDDVCESLVFMASPRWRNGRAKCSCQNRCCLLDRPWTGEPCRALERTSCRDVSVTI